MGMPKSAIQERENGNQGGNLRVEEPVWFAFSASLRIFGEGLDLDGITRTLGLEPTHQHRKGECPGKRRQPWAHDMWIYEVQVGESCPLEEHIMALWNLIRPHMSYLRGLKQHCQVDVFCGYRSNSTTAGIDVEHSCLGLFLDLEVPFRLSVIVG